MRSTVATGCALSPGFADHVHRHDFKVATAVLVHNDCVCSLDLADVHVVDGGLVLHQLVVSVLIDGINEVVTFVDYLCVDALYVRVSLGSHQLACVPLPKLEAVSAWDEVAVCSAMLALDDHLQKGIGDAVLRADVDGFLLGLRLDGLQIEPGTVECVACLVSFREYELSGLLLCGHSFEYLCCDVLTCPANGSGVL